MSLGNHIFIGVELSTKTLISNDLYKLKQGHFSHNQKINIKINELLNIESYFFSIIKRITSSATRAFVNLTNSSVDVLKLHVEVFIF